MLLSGCWLVNWMCCCFPTYTLSRQWRCLLHRGEHWLILATFLKKCNLTYAQKVARFVLNKKSIQQTRFTHINFWWTVACINSESCCSSQSNTCKHASLHVKTDEQQSYNNMLYRSVVCKMGSWHGNQGIIRQILYWQFYKCFWNTIYYFNFNLMFVDA